MYQDVVDVSEDGKTAKGRFRCNMQAGLHESAWPKDPNAKFLKQWWEGALYENEYIKENGVWKLKTLRYRPQWHATFEKGMYPKFMVRDVDVRMGSYSCQFHSVCVDKVS